MAYPPTYSRAKDFTDETGAQTNHTQLNAELDALGELINLLNANAQLIQRSDTLLANAAVHARALASDALALIASSSFTVKGAWLTATDYVIGDMVEEAGSSYVCAIAHTSGVFATDDAAGRWVIISPLSISSAEAQTLIDDTLQSDGPVFAAAAGTADVMTATLTPTLTAYADGMRVRIRALGANTVTAPTLNIDGLGARTITKLGGRALVAGDIDQAGHELDLVYRSSASRFELTNPAVRIASATGHALVRAASAAAGRSALSVPGLAVANVFTKRQTLNYSTLASAATLDLSTVDGNVIYVTGGVGVTAISAHGVGTVIDLIFAGALTLTHHAADLILPGAANIVTAAGDSARFVEYATGDWRCIGYERASGLPLTGGQVVTATDATYNSVTSVIASDDTIPQSSEGEEIVTASITPRKAGNKLLVTFQFVGSPNASMQVAGALFLNAETDARYVSWDYASASGFPFGVSGEFVMDAIDTSAHEFKLRVGVNGGTFYLNGSSSARFYGGKSEVRLTVQEIQQ